MKILVAILSCWQYGERRQAQRETWLPRLKGADYRFFLGVTPPTSVWQRAAHDEESLICPDHYAALCQKTKALTRWADAHDYDFLFKADDDSFIVPERLLASGFEQHDYSGWLEERGPHSHCPFDVIPWAQGGSGYWLKRPAIKIVAQHMMDLKHAEDTAVGRTLAQHGIRGVHDSRYQPQVTQREREYPSESAISFHKCSPQEMKSLHQRIYQSTPIHLKEKHHNG